MTMADDTQRRKPRRRRIILWVALPAVVVLGAVASWGIWHKYQSSSSFHVGTCFEVIEETYIKPAGGLREIGGRARVVSCDAPHGAKITRTAGHASDCAAEGAWLNSRQQTYCVTLSS
ncbi:hypothetical protein Lfu02_77220 [Longispora fulva]|uniref:Uncharacterized protein n=1 Tax=Longispora fulva TaxID=619741 RepID=A0A8J7GDZ7_9ACTN|nr:hypothetical protein [Longispora fulva]MBG6136160.1 hypothetical protein [Longispora fulva]GIG63350.1 hypothetical protein Lfu02_77220 [Longispora fulva]